MSFVTLVNNKNTENKEKKLSNISFKTMFYDFRKSRAFYSIISILLAIYIGWILNAILGFSNSDFYSIWAETNFGSTKWFGDFLGTFSWIFFIGLSLMVSFKAGVFNIGAAGQMILGGVFAYYLGTVIDVGRFLGPIFMLFFAIGISSFIALFIGVLKTRFKVNEVISSIMLNWIIYYFFLFMINGPIAVDSVGSYKELNPNNSLQLVWLTNMFGGSNLINIGIIFVVFALPIFYYIYKKTTFGYKQKLIGSNSSVTNYVGLNKNNELLKSFAISGALAGLAGALVFLGQTNPEFDQFNYGEIPSMFFNGITVSLLGANNPIGIFFSAIFVASFQNSSTWLQTVTNSIPMDQLIFALAVLFISSITFFQKYNLIYKIKLKFYSSSSSNKKKEEKKEGDK